MHVAIKTVKKGQEILDVADAVTFTAISVVLVADVEETSSVRGYIDCARTCQVQPIHFGQTASAA